MRGEMPRPGAAHGKSTQGNPAGINVVVPLHLLQRLEDIRLTREFEGIAIASVRVQDERVGWGEFSGGTFAFGDEFQLRELIIPAMQPDVQSSCGGRLGG